MRITVLTLFPEMFPAVLDASIIGLARQKGLVEFGLVNIRDFALDRHQVTDDTPYGGGPGMIMKPEPIYRAVRSLEAGGSRPTLILLSPRGQRYDQAAARQLSREADIALLCGHYKDVDERVRAIVDRDISVGDYVLSGGEVAALAVIDSIVRLLPGAISDPASAERDSFEDGLLDHPHYTRPDEFEGMRVPEVLRSGNHAAIDRWRRRQALRITEKHRPDLLARKRLGPDDLALLAGDDEENHNRQP